MTSRFSYSMAFLKTSAGGDPTEYCRKYLSGEAVSRTGVRPVAAEELNQAALVVNETDWPPLADPEVLRAKFPSSVRAYLEEALPIALQNFRERFPLLPGETITRDFVTALTSDWRGVPKGTVIYQRQTNLGTIAFGVLTMTIDLETGATSYAKPEAVLPPEMPADLALVEASDSAKTVIDGALIIAQFAGFALGPEGLILSGGAAVLQMIFDRCMSKQHVSLSEQVAGAVRVVGVELKLESIDATIGTDYDWLRNRYDSAWADHPAPVSNQEYEDFKRHLGDKLAGDTGIMHDVNLLNEPSYRFPGFPLYLLGASLVLLLLKIDLLIRSSDKSVVDTNAFTALINTLKTYIENAEATKAVFDKKISARLRNISQLHRGEECHWIPVPGSFGTYSCVAGWAFKDGTEQFLYPDTSKSVGCKSQDIQHKAEAAAGREKYYAKVQAQLSNKYFRGDPEKVADILAKWKETLDEYQSYLPNK